jgi:hypothetical protein
VSAKQSGYLSRYSYRRLPGHSAWGDKFDVFRGIIVMLADMEFEN